MDDADEVEFVGGVVEEATMVVVEGGPLIVPKSQSVEHPSSTLLIQTNSLGVLE